MPRDSDSIDVLRMACVNDIGVLRMIRWLTVDGLPRELASGLLRIQFLPGVVPGRVPCAKQFDGI